MESNSPYRVLPGAQGLVWLKAGWAMFTRDIGTWVAIILVWWVLDGVCGMIPLLGNATMVLDPVLAAGLVIGCDQLRRSMRDVRPSDTSLLLKPQGQPATSPYQSSQAVVGNKLDISCLFAGFDRSRLGPLLLLGVINLLVDLVGNTLSTGAAMLFGAGALLNSVHDLNMNVDLNNIDQVQQLTDRMSAMLSHLLANLGPLLLTALPGLYAALAVKFLLACAVTLAFYFAPALIVLSRQDAWAAIRHSWQATAVNWLSITMYGVWFIAAVGVALLPALLACSAAYAFGPIWLVLGLPLLFLTLLVLAVPATVVGVTGAYLAYRDIFADLPTEQSRTRGLDEPARQH
ncbi:MAG: hypothetical protein JO218_02035 [Burkholderiales bacterium]|nr:hypothetical protein [Burkholderiales bacterium]